MHLCIETRLNASFGWMWVTVMLSRLHRTIQFFKQCSFTIKEPGGTARWSSGANVALEVWICFHEQTKIAVPSW